MSQTKAIIQPDSVNSVTPVELNNSFDFTAPREVIQSIKRTLTIYATIDAEKKSQDIYEDFRIEELANKPLQ